MNWLSEPLNVETAVKSKAYLLEFPYLVTLVVALITATGLGDPRVNGGDDAVFQGLPWLRED